MIVPECAAKTFRVLHEGAIGVDDVAVEVRGSRLPAGHRLEQRVMFETAVFPRAADHVSLAFLALRLGGALETDVLDLVSPSIDFRQGWGVLRHERLGQS